MLDILFVVVGLLIGYLGTSLINNYLGNNETNDNSNNITLNGGKVKFKNYIFTLPDNVLYFSNIDDENSSLIILNSSDKWVATIELYDKSNFESDLFDNYDKLANNIHNNTLRDVKNTKIMKKDDIEIVSFETFGEETNGLFAYVPTYDNYEFEIVLFDGDNKTINYKALDTVIDILVNGEKIK